MVDAIIYFVLIGLWSAVASYVAIFRIGPLLRFGSARSADTVDPLLADHHAPLAAHPAPSPHAPVTDRRRSFSAYEGFKSFAKGPELTVEDIVKGLSRNG